MNVGWFCLMHVNASSISALFNMLELTGIIHYHGHTSHPLALFFNIQTDTAPAVSQKPAVQAEPVIRAGAAGR